MNGDSSQAASPGPSRRWEMSFTAVFVLVLALILIFTWGA